ncbi:MAG: thioesterase family protein [Pseudomonadota bacterium]
MSSDSPIESPAGPLARTRLTVKPEWIDHNGHMNVAFFVLAFDEATDTVYDDWGIGLEYPDKSGCSVFTLGMNVDYRAELFEGDSIDVTTQLVAMDAKRLHYFHRMYKAETGAHCASNECLVMNVDLGTRRSAPFPADVLSKLTAIHAAHSELGLPEDFGRRLEIRRADSASAALSPTQ